MPLSGAEVDVLLAAGGGEVAGDLAGLLEPVGFVTGPVSKERELDNLGYSD